MCFTSFWSCKPAENTKQTLAKVYDKHLFLDDLVREYPPNINPNDSVVWVNNYIRSWISSELLLHEAENKLNNNDLDVIKQMQRYRKSLLIYKYENSILPQVDTVVSEADIKAVYPNYHTPKKNIDHTTQAKGFFFMFPWDKVDVNTVTQLSKDQRFNDLISYGKKFASSMTDYSKQWTNLSDLIDLMPVKADGNNTNFSKKNYLESSDTDFYYFLCIYKFKQVSATSLMFDESDIRRAIINRRKQEFLKQLEEQLLEKAENSNNIMIY